MPWEISPVSLRGHGCTPAGSQPLGLGPCWGPKRHGPLPLAAIPKAYKSIVTKHRQGWVVGTAATGSLRKVTAWQVPC